MILSKEANLPVVVRTCMIILQHLANVRSEERGYTIYFKDSDYLVVEDYGEGFLTTSGILYTNIKSGDVKFIAEADCVYLLHTHPFQDFPTPSQSDIETAKRFRSFYRRVYCVVIGRKGVKWY